MNKMHGWINVLFQLLNFFCFYQAGLLKIVSLIGDQFIGAVFCRIGSTLFWSSIL